MPEPTREDAHIYLQLLEVAQGSAQAEARRWVFGDFAATTLKEAESRYPRGSVERDHLMNVLGFFESAGGLVSRGLLHEDVFFDAPFGFEALWPQLKGVIAEWRAGDPPMWENVQWLGLRMEAWHKTDRKSKLDEFPPDKPPEKGEPAIRGFQH